LTPYSAVLPALGAELETVLRRTIGDPALRIRDVQPLAGGHSGELFSFVARMHGNDQLLVVRLAPGGVAPRGPADVGRQGRLIASLHAHGAPVPRVLASSSEPEILERAFAVMEMVEGEGWETFVDRTDPETTADAAIDALERIQAVPVANTGIADEPWPSDPLAEVARWERLLQRSHEANTLAAVLRAQGARADVTARQVLVHGDYHFGNLLFGERSVSAILDWEIASIGHPLTDLACLGVAVLRRRFPGEPNPTGSLDLPLPALAARYGADEDVFTWHLALSCYKYAGILAYNLYLHQTGRKIDPVYDELQGTIRGLLAEGLVMLGSGITDY